MGLFIGVIRLTPYKIPSKLILVAYNAVLFPDVRLAFQARILCEYSPTKSGNVRCRVVADWFDETGHRIYTLSSNNYRCSTDEMFIRIYIVVILIIIF